MSLLAGAKLITENPGGYAGWRVLFWIGAGVYALAFALVLVGYHPQRIPNPENKTVMARLAVIDYIGLLLLSFALTPLIMVSSRYSWSSNLATTAS